MTSDLIILWFDYSDDFANMLSVSLEENSAKKSLMEYALGEVEKQNKRTDSLAAEWDLNTLSEIPSEELAMSNASRGYLIYGSNTRRKPMKIRTVFGFLQNENGSKFIKLFGIVSANPGHPVYDDEEEWDRYLYDLKVDILTTRFE